jgi:peroxiredoxin
VLAAGENAPSFKLTDIDTGESVADPWSSDDRPLVLAFFKVSCPVCQMVAPKVTAMAEEGARVVAVGEDPPDELQSYRERHGQDVPTLSEPAPYDVAEAYGLETVPSIFLVGSDGQVLDAVGGWNRDRWNEVALAAGASGPISTPEDGLRPFRPG